jgi:hypothetical protein
LRVVCRDLPRNDIRDYWKFAWGLDHAWFTREEARALVPKAVKGSRQQIKRELVERLGRFHLVDSVRGRESLPFPPEAVQIAELTSEVIDANRNRVSLKFYGRTRTIDKTELFPDKPAAQMRGFDAQLLGRGEYDRKRERFTIFELLAIGERRGATSCNMRIQDDDLGPAPMGVLLMLASDSPADAVPPAFLGRYGWPSKSAKR